MAIFSVALEENTQPKRQYTFRAGRAELLAQPGLFFRLVWQELMERRVKRRANRDAFDFCDALADLLRRNGK